MAKKQKPASGGPSIQPASADDPPPAGKPPKARAQRSSGRDADRDSSPASPPDALPPLAKAQGFKAVTIDRRRIANAEYNPRTISPAQRRKLRKSLERFKLVETLVWNVRTGNLVGGHQRLSQIDDMEGSDAYSLTVSQVDVDDTTERALNIALNNPENQGQYDIAMLADVIGDVRKTSPGLVQDAGFDLSNLSMLFGDEFLLPHERAQASSDAPVVADLDAMYEAGAAAQRAKAAKASAASAASSDDPSDNDAESDPSSDPSADPSSDPSGGEGEQTYGKAGWTKQDFKDRRREYSSQRTLVDEANSFLVLVFDSGSQIGTLLESLGLNPNLTTIDASQFLGAIGVELPSVSAEEPVAPSAS